MGVIRGLPKASVRRDTENSNRSSLLMSSPESLTSIVICFFIIDPKKFFISIVIRMTNEIEPSLIRVWGKDNENSPNFVEELGEF